MNFDGLMEKMDTKQMVLDAWESMKTGREGYFWDVLEVIDKGKCESITELHFEYSNNNSTCYKENFSFTDPNPKIIIPKKYTLVWTQNHGDYWPAVSSGRLDEDDKLFLYSSLDELKSSRNGFSVDKWWLELPKETDPGPSNTPPKGIIVMVKDYHQSWFPTKFRISQGKISNDGRLLVDCPAKSFSYQSWEQWKRLQNGMVPEDLR